MATSIWRWAHWVLAMFSFAFLIVASVTGVILSFVPVQHKLQVQSIDNFEQLTLSETIPSLKEHFYEVIQIEVDYNQNVLLEGFDEEGNEIKAYVNPISGEILAQPQIESDFISWNRNFHRSLFLKETGRFLIGVISVLLLLIAVSGAILVIKRQKGFRHFFASIKLDSWSQYLHVVTGRWMLLPIIIISASGGYLFMYRFELINYTQPEFAEIESIQDYSEEAISPKEFKLFQTISMDQVQKIEFPLFEDPEEFYKLKLKDREILVDQFNGQIIQEIQIDRATQLERLSFDLHTGQFHWIWSIILGFASLNILYFIYSGFVIFFKRNAVRIKNKYSANDAEIVLLFGSENGSTKRLAQQIQKQILNQKGKIFVGELNSYQTYSNAKKLIILTSTYGLGDAPTNANQFLKKVEKVPQNQFIDVFVVGLGSRAYEHFCGFAEQVYTKLQTQNWANLTHPMFPIHDQSLDEFIEWAKIWNQNAEFPLSVTPAQYAQKLPQTIKIKLKNRTEAQIEENFIVQFQTNQKFKSGDLLAIYPEKDHRERLYSIAKMNGEIQLAVKLHLHGLGSQFLHQLKIEDEIEARIISNPNFHFPTKSKRVLMIANGTGVAPFLGMIDENHRKIETHLFVGFRTQNEWVKSMAQALETQVQKGKLRKVHWAFSRENEKTYVKDLILKEENLFVETLQQKGTIMICGALAMQKDVELILESFCQKWNLKSVEYYRQKGQIKTDCY